ncbi:MAG: branched-chain amino acid ABC transporter permease [Chloroflexota bacterium]
MDIFISALGFGIVTASILSLAAVGFTLQVGVTNVVNLAYGSMLTTGAFLAYIIQNAVHLNIWAAMAFAAISLGIISMLINRIFVTPFIRRGVTHFNMMLVTFSVGIILEYIIVAFYGQTFYSLSGVPQNSVFFGQILLTGGQIVIIVLAVLAMLAVHILLRYTKVGKAMRAIADDKALARGSGINVDLVMDLTWLLSGALAGVAGVALGIDSGSFSEILGNNFLLVVVAAAVLGGAGKPYGAMIGAIFVGIIMEVSTVWISSEYKEIVALAALVAVVLYRPQGIIRGVGKAVVVK